MNKKLLVLGVLASATLFASVHAQQASGRFEGKFIASFLDDGRNVQLEQSYSFIDARGQRWDVPAGTRTDGASIPQVFWVAYPPFTGRYRDAAVIHDYFCQTQVRSWQDTHNVFFEAMRSAGVDERTSKVMWAAVYNFGPRWGAGARRGPNLAHVATIDDQKRFLANVEAWVSASNPSLDKLADAIESGDIPK